MNKAVQHESLEVAIDCRFGRSEFSRELGNPKWFLGARQALQQAQREVDRSGRRPRLVPMDSCDFGHVSLYETMFQKNATAECPRCQRIDHCCRATRCNMLKQSGMLCHAPSPAIEAWLISGTGVHCPDL